jgi:hypothetical protein
MNQTECGHFIERERMATRYHPHNVMWHLGVLLPLQAYQLYVIGDVQ